MYIIIIQYTCRYMYMYVYMYNIMLTSKSVRYFSAGLKSVMGNWVGCPRDDCPL